MRSTFGRFAPRRTPDAEPPACFNGCQKNTLEYLGLWEKLNNPNFKGVEFDPLLKEAGSNSFTMSPTRWVELTAAIGILTKNGAGGGTYAQRDIAFKFANWVSVEFELYLVMEFQRLKAKEQELIGWSAKRELSKINYRIHTDAIKSHLIPEEVTSAQASIIYAEEADVLNVAMFGMTAKQWREANKAQPDCYSADAGFGGKYQIGFLRGCKSMRSKYMSRVA